MQPFTLLAGLGLALAGLGCTHQPTEGELTAIGRAHETELDTLRKILLCAPPMTKLEAGRELPACPGVTQRERQAADAFLRTQRVKQVELGEGECAFVDWVAFRSFAATFHSRGLVGCGTNPPRYILDAKSRSLSTQSKKGMVVVPVSQNWFAFDWR